MGYFHLFSKVGVDVGCQDVVAVRVSQDQVKGTISHRVTLNAESFAHSASSAGETSQFYQAPE